jgi:hypothetical protein
MILYLELIPVIYVIRHDGSLELSVQLTFAHLNRSFHFSSQQPQIVPQISNLNSLYEPSGLHRHLCLCGFECGEEEGDFLGLHTSKAMLCPYSQLTWSNNGFPSKNNFRTSAEIPRISCGSLASTRSSRSPGVRKNNCYFSLIITDRNTKNRDGRKH